MRISMNQRMVKRIKLALPYAKCINHREFVQLAIAKFLYEIENENGPLECHGNRSKPEYVKMIIKCRAY